MRNIFLVISTLVMISCSGGDDNLNNLVESDNFLKDNLSNPGVFEIEAGLQYEKLKTSGSGISPSLEDVINADFHGTLLDGSVFWSSIENGEPSFFRTYLILLFFIFSVSFPKSKIRE